MTDYQSRVSKKAMQLMLEANARHAVFGVAYKTSDQPFDMHEQTALKEGQILLFYDNITYQKWIDEIVEQYRKKGVDLYTVYAVHKEA